MYFLRTRYFLLLGLCLPLLLWGQGARREEILRRGVLRVGTTGDYAPFSYRANAASPFVGLDIELAGLLTKALGVRLELVATSWPTLMQDLRGDRFDIAMSGVSISVERQRQAAFSLSYLRDGKTPITRCENRERFQTLAQIDRSGVRVVVNPGGTNERFVRAHLREASIVVWPDNVSIFDRIVAGEADLMITDAIEARLQQRLRPGLCAVHPDAPFNVSEKAFLLPQDEAWKATVDGWLQPLLERQEVSRLLEKWLSHPWPRAAPAAIEVDAVLQRMAERLALMPEVARHKWNRRAAIEDVAREAQVLSGLRREAEAVGIPAEWAERFFRAQIEAAKIIQREHFARWEAAGSGNFTEVPDLETVIRPQLDELTQQLLRELAMAWPAISDPAQRSRISAAAERVLGATGKNSAAAEYALRPLLEPKGATIRP